MKWILILGLLVCSSFAMAEEGETPSSSTSKKWGVYGSYSYLDTWLPGKWGIIGSYQQDFVAYELALQQASYSFDFVIDDLGKIRDRRIHLSRRSFAWEGSFNYQLGLYYNSVSVTLGKSYMGVVGVEFDVVSVSTAGVMGGIGNRWTLDKGWSFGVDWLKVFYPIWEISRNDDYVKEADDEDNKNAVDGLLDAIANIPTISLLHIELGYRF